MAIRTHHPSCDVTYLCQSTAAVKVGSTDTKDDVGKIAALVAAASAVATKQRGSRYPNPAIEHSYLPLKPRLSFNALEPAIPLQKLQDLHQITQRTFLLGEFCLSLPQTLLQ